MRQHSGESFYSWGEDFQISLRDRMSPPAFDYVGRGGRIWVGDGFAARTLGTERMRKIIDASTDRAPSLADDEDYQLAARLLGEQGALTGIFSSASFAVSDLIAQFTDMFASGPTPRATLEEVEKQVSAGPLLLPFTVLGTGMAFEGDTEYTLLVTIQDTPQAAAENAERLRERIETGIRPLGNILTPDKDSEPVYWRDIIREFEIETVGRAVVLRLPDQDVSDIALNYNEFFGGVILPLAVHE